MTLLNLSTKGRSREVSKLPYTKPRWHVEEIWGGLSIFGEDRMRNGGRGVGEEVETYPIMRLCDRKRGYTPGEKEANGQIAATSPEMYEALIALLDTRDIGGSAPAWAKAEAAVKKAETFGAR